jgi:transcriptional antiterminator NusG
MVTDEPNKLVDDAIAERAAVEGDDARVGARSADDQFDAAGANGDTSEPAVSEPRTEAAEDVDMPGEMASFGADEPAAAGEPVEEMATAESAAEDVAEEQVEEEGEAEEEDSGSGPVYLAPDLEEEIRMDWYILKVQSNRERSIAEALQRKFAIEGLSKYCDQVIVPTEKVTEFKGGKKKVVERKLYPGYIVVHMHINDDTWFAVRETSGVGDFTGAGGKPTPMLPHEVSRIIQTETEETEETPKLDIKFSEGDKVKVKEGNFENFEGEVGSIDEASGRVTVMINIFGRSTPVELEYWQIEAM